MEFDLLQDKIHVVRSIRVIFDFDLAKLYGVETRVLKQAVRRNIDRFPHDFMYELTNKEVDDMVSQFVIPSKRRLGGSLPFAFSEQGVAMLSIVLRSDKAIQVNIAIMRAFVILRKHLSDYKALKEQIESLQLEMNLKFKDIDQALVFLLQKEKESLKQKRRNSIGFKSR